MDFESLTLHGMKLSASKTDNTILVDNGEIFHSRRIIREEDNIFVK